MGMNGISLLLPVVVATVREVNIPGDVLVGGLFPVHAAGSNGSACGKIKAEQGVQRMVAMMFALEMFNNESFVPDIRLGAQLLDTCSVDHYALEQSLEFVRAALSKQDDCIVGPLTQKKKPPIAAVVGAASSQVSVMVASMLQLFKIKRLNWTYVHAVADSGSYGEKGMEAFRAAATKLGVCIDGDVHKIGRRPTDQEFKEVIARMRRNKARGVVMFVDEDNLKQFLKKLSDMVDENPSEYRGHFWFVASDSWGKKASVVESLSQPATIQGAVTIAPMMGSIPGFDNYFKRLRGDTNNTFLQEYWQHLNCPPAANTFEECFEMVEMTFTQETYVPFVVDAVKAVATAIGRYIKAECGSLSYQQCNLTSFDGNILQKFYRNVSLANGESPKIDVNGDGIGKYKVYQLSEIGRYVEVGTWLSENDFHLNDTYIRQKLSNTSNFPFSVCSRDCPKGQFRIYQDQACCWSCIECPVATSIVVNITSCVECPREQVPNGNLTRCVDIVPIPMTWLSLWALLPAAFSVFGLIATLFVFCVFLKYSTTPVIMASGRELCYCMLMGISLCYILTFFLVSDPNIFVCGMSRLLIGLCMSAIYAAIITKTNRLSRVFSPNSAQMPRFITPKAQVCITGVIVSVQLLGSLIWLSFDPPGTTKFFPTRTEAIKTCKATALQLLVSLSYNMLLIIACTVYAFKTRKIPENFNETRLIGFTMYSTSILWLAFVPIYFATQNNFRIQMTSLCMCISLSGSVALVCFFAPKVYIVLFQPYKNVRCRQSAVGRLVNQQMRFISQLTSHAEHPPPHNPSYKPDSEENSAVVTRSVLTVTENGRQTGKKLSWNEADRRDHVGSLRRLKRSFKMRSKSVREKREQPSEVSLLRRESMPAEDSSSDPPPPLLVPPPNDIQLILDHLVINAKATFL